MPGWTKLEPADHKQVSGPYLIEAAAVQIFNQARDRHSTSEIAPGVPPDFGRGTISKPRLKFLRAPTYFD